MQTKQLKIFLVSVILRQLLLKSKTQMALTSIFSKLLRHTPRQLLSIFSQVHRPLNNSNNSNNRHLLISTSQVELPQYKQHYHLNKLQLSVLIAIPNSNSNNKLLKRAVLWIYLICPLSSSKDLWMIY